MRQTKIAYAPICLSGLAAILTVLAVAPPSTPLWALILLLLAAPGLGIIVLAAASALFSEALNAVRHSVREYLLSRPDCRAGLDAWAHSVAALFWRDAISTRQVYLERNLLRIRVWRPGGPETKGRISDALREEIILQYRRELSAAAGPWRSTLLSACGASVPLPQLSQHQVIKALGKISAKTA